MRFSKEKFLLNADMFEKKAYLKYVESMDGLRVDFKKGSKYGTVTLNEEEYIYPIKIDWSVKEWISKRYRKLLTNYTA